MEKTMSRLLSASLLVAIFVGADIQGQLPPNKIFLSDGNAASGSTNAFPWSREQLRYQTIFPAALFNNQPCLVNDILVAPSTTMSPTIRTAVYADIEIRMGPTAQASPTTAWTINNPTPTTVYRGPMRVTFEKGMWRGMGLPKPYVHIPTPAKGANLCVEFIMWKITSASGINAVTAPSTVQRAFYYMWTVSQTTQPTVGSSAARMGLICNNGHFVVTETGCMSSSNTTLAISADTYPKQGNPISISLTGGQPGTPAFLVVGGTDTKSALGTFPIDAGPLGAPGCFIWNDWSGFVATATDKSGGATLKFTVPKIGSAPRAYVHWWNFDKNANTLGVTSSNYGKILMGD
jgi:hypothetical protein